jgi:3-hydroxy-9,10-secoandrosta-1,3,5(10)-triene-9,17-dione monooxygenase reductase component
MGNFCSGIVVVTAIDSGEPVGFTAQSFVSLSLDPPLVAVCPAKTSTSWERIRNAKRYCINILSDQQENLSNAFASSKNENKFEGVNWKESANGCPLIEGTVAYVDCDIEVEHEAGDHFIAIGLVKGFKVSEGLEQPLLYFRGNYNELKNKG